MTDRQRTHIEVDWTARRSDGDWARLEKSGTARETPHRKVLDWGPVIIGERGRVSQLVAVLEPPEDMIRFHYHCWPAPSDPPPAHVLQASEKLGGATGYSELIQGLVGQSAPAEYRVSWRLDSKKYKCGSIPGDVIQGDPVLKLAPGAKVEQIGYRLDGGALGITEVAIVYLHKTARYLVNIVSNGVFTPQANLEDAYENQISNLVQNAFFEASNAGGV